MKKPSTFVFTVEGSGEFPFDMLRYDECWPMSEGRDSYGLTERGRRRVVLRTSNQHAPTVGRWDSFSWRVVGVGDLRDATEFPTPQRRTA